MTIKGVTILILPRGVKTLTPILKAAILNVNTKNVIDPKRGKFREYPSHPLFYRGGSDGFSKFYVFLLLDANFAEILTPFKNNKN